MVGGERENWTVLVTIMSKCCISHVHLTILFPIDLSIYREKEEVPRGG